MAHKLSRCAAAAASQNSLQKARPYKTYCRPQDQQFEIVAVSRPEANCLFNAGSLTSRMADSAQVLPKKRPWYHPLALARRLVIYALIGYVTICVYLSAMQTRMIYVGSPPRWR